MKSVDVAFHSFRENVHQHRHTGGGLLRSKVEGLSGPPTEQHKGRDPFGVSFRSCSTRFTPHVLHQINFYKSI